MLPKYTRVYASIASFFCVYTKNNLNNYILTRVKIIPLAVNDAAFLFKISSKCSLNCCNVFVCI